MALIRCPQCDTGHELDDALLSGGKRRVRCASCRTIWSAEMPAAPKAAEDDWGDVLATDSPAAPPPADEPQSQGDIDSLFDAPLKGAEPQSQGDIDSLFDAPAPPAAPKSQGDVDALFAEESKPATAVEPIIVPLAIAAKADDSLEAAAERRSERRRRAAAPTPPPTPPQPPPAKAGSIAVMFLAASIGTFGTLLIFRHDVARLAPWTEPVFEKIGLPTKDFGLMFEDVRSRIAREDGRETLEVVGTIVNKTSKRQMLPMLRLAIKGEAGQELYVWTATADQADIAGLDRVKFRRRLASPPGESHQVEVRFVPAQDVVASVR
jgi:predicted Zn finger-like uncharacterized protein